MSLGQARSLSSSRTPITKKRQRGLDTLTGEEEEEENV